MAMLFGSRSKKSSSENNRYGASSEVTTLPPLATAVALDDIVPIPMPATRNSHRQSTTTITASAPAMSTMPAPIMATVVNEPVSSNSSNGRLMQVQQHSHQQSRPQHQQQQRRKHERPVVSTLGRHPVMMNCPICHQESSTRTVTYPNWLTWLTVGGVMMAFWPLCWVPLCCDSVKKTDHICLSCGEKVGSVAPYSDCCVNERG